MIELKLPKQAPNAIASVIKMEVKGKMNAAAALAKDKMKAGELD